MTRDAKLYLLEHKDWKLLIGQIELHKNKSLKELVIVFDIFHSYPQHHHYAILSLTEDIDKIIEEYGAKEAEQNDLLRNALHDYNGNPVYGDKSKVIYLNRIP